VSGACNGSCCVVFPLKADGRFFDHFLRYTDGAYIADMIEPLTVDAAKARWAAHGIGEWPEKYWSGHDEMYSCRHWDAETRLCRAYDERPAMCRDYPYGGPCNAECGFDAELDGPTLLRYGRDPATGVLLSETTGGATDVS